MREEDEVGDADDGLYLEFAFYACRLLNNTPTEFAEYTSAQERIALGKKSRKAEAAKRRDTMKEMIADAYVFL
jgi:GC-rich sequence DNA-binding factor